jgi:hypothetical protein
MVLFWSGSANLNAYLAHPESEGSFPGLMVIHEAFGLNYNIKRIAARFAGEGYWALVVALFAGRKLNATLERHSIPHGIKIYPNARHSFFNDESRNHDPGRLRRLLASDAGLLRGTYLLVQPLKGAELLLRSPWICYMPTTSSRCIPGKVPLRQSLTTQMLPLANIFDTLTPSANLEEGA